MRGLRRIAAVVGAIVVLSSCAVDETLPEPSCTGGPSSVLIVAQSVPTASMLPCFDPLPAGWEIQTMQVNESGTTVVMDSDRAGFSAANLRYLASCDVGSAAATPTDYDNTERFEAIWQVAPRFQADRFYQFEGGCLWWQFDFDVGVPSAMSVELGNALQLVGRQEFNDSFRTTFVDEDI